MLAAVNEAVRSGRALMKLTAENYRMLYVPKGFAHGFITLEDDVQVRYQVSGFYEPTAEPGARHDDPAFGIEWPIEPVVVSEKDQSWPRFSDGVRPT